MGGFEGRIKGITRSEAGRQEKISDSRKGCEVIFGQPENGFQEMGREGKGRKDFCDGFSGEVD